MVFPIIFQPNPQGLPPLVANWDALPQIQVATSPSGISNSVRTLQCKPHFNAPSAYLPAGGDDIDKWREAITNIDDVIAKADLKANSNDPIERAHWRNRTGSLQSEKLILRNLIFARKQKETMQLDLILRRKRSEADMIDGLIRFGKIGDSTMLCSASKY
jgi:hypothetical protein